MLFTEVTFLFYFLPAALLIHAITSRGIRGGRYNSASCLAIFILTLCFYGSKEPWWILPFIVSILFDFVWATLLARFQNARLRLVLVGLSVFQNLALLSLFKYWNPLVEALVGYGWTTPEMLPRLLLDGHALPLPAGISFYTFESLSFVIDVYRREIVPPRNPLSFFAFIGMFPRFIAGPIIRYKNLEAQFQNYPGMNLEAGLRTFIYGLFLKVCFADSFAPFVGYAFGQEGDLSFFSAWIGVFAYTMQLYFDFSGYATMAIGLGKCFGFTFPINFDRPYLATSLQDFWRRWHISLSSWLRDYLYVSLGGNRRGVLRLYLNLFVTMTLGGIWHGAGLTFLVWGMWHGLGLCLERASGLSERLARITQRVATFLFVMVGWVFFRGRDLIEALLVLKAMFVPRRGMWDFQPEFIRTHSLSALMCLAGILFCFCWEERVPRYFSPAITTGFWRSVGTYMIFIGTLVLLLSAFNIPFLYFQF